MSLQAVQRFTQKHSYAVMGCLLAINDSPLSDCPASIPEVIQTVLQEFEDVFSEPRGLPPVRTHNHTIPLKEGANPISGHPYPQIQKTEIEEQVDKC